MARNFWWNIGRKTCVILRQFQANP
jgi:hypothetical protein